MALLAQQPQETLELQLRNLIKEGGTLNNFNRLLEEARMRNTEAFGRLTERIEAAPNLWDACMHVHVHLNISPQLPLPLDLRKMLPECLAKRSLAFLAAGILASAFTSWLVCALKGWGPWAILWSVVGSSALLLLPAAILRCLQRAGANERNIYCNLVRLRVGYFMFMTFALTFSVFSGTTIETLLGTFSDVLRGDFAILSLWTLPLLMVLLGMFSEGCITLFFDAIQKAPLIELQATLLLGMYLIFHSRVRRLLWLAWFLFVFVGFYVLDHVVYTVSLVTSVPLVWCIHSRTPFPLEGDAPVRRPALWLCKLTDLTCFVAIEAIPPTVGYWWGVIWHADMPDGRGPIGAFFRSYLWASILMCLLTVTLFQFCSMVLYFLHAGTNDHLGKKRDLHRCWVQTFYKHMMVPGTLAQVHAYIFPDEDIDVSLCGPAYRHAARGKTLVSFRHLVLSFVLVLLLAMLPVRVYVRNGVLLLAIVAGSTGLYVAWQRWRPSVVQNDDIPVPTVFVALLSWLFWSWVCWVSALQGGPVLPQKVVAAFVAVLIWTHCAFKAYFPDLLGRAYRVVVFIYAVVVGLLMWSQDQALELPARAATVIVRDKDVQGLHWRLPHSAARHYSDYGICQQTFGSRHGVHALTAIDLSQLAGVVYEEHCSAIELALPELFAARAPRVSSCSSYREFPRFVVFDFGRNDSNGTRVLAIKGTSTVFDALVEATLYSTVKILQLLECVLPVVDLLPVDQVQWVLWRYHSFGHWEAEERFWKRLLLRTSRLARETQRRTILTGHSLGGAVASVLAARLDLDAVVFSAPGTEFSAVRFGIYQRSYWMHWQGVGGPCEHCGVQLSKERILNVVPMFDVMPRVDRQLEQLQHIECRAKRQGRGSPLEGATACHSLRRTACELWRVCGDPAHNRSFRCGEFVSVSTEGLLFEPDDPY